MAGRAGAAALVALMLAGTGAAAQTARCAEEILGTCVRFEKSLPAPRPAPPPPSAEEVAETRLGLDREARRGVQVALSRTGHYAGTQDGLFGPGTRRAIRAWQRAEGRAATGFLTAGDHDLLLAILSRPAPPAPPVASVTPPAPPVAPPVAPPAATAPPADPAAPRVLAVRGRADVPGAVWNGRATVTGNEVEFEFTLAFRRDRATWACRTRIEPSGKVSCFAEVRERTGFNWGARWISGTFPNVAVVASGQSIAGGAEFDFR